MENAIGGRRTRKRGSKHSRHQKRGKTRLRASKREQRGFYKQSEPRKIKFFGRNKPVSFAARNKNKLGALSELRVCTDLLAKGFDVFRAVSPSCDCDLVAIKGQKVIRVESRTARYGKAGKIYFPGKKNDTGKQDVFAAVLPDQIVYSPTLESLL